MKEISLAEAKCASCRQVFSHPTLGDFSYGEAVLCSLDGKNYAFVNALADFPQRVSSLIKSDKELTFWPTLASLAEPIRGQSLTASIRCSHCGSDKLEYWGGQVTGTASIPEASFTTASELSTNSLAKQIGAVVSSGHVS
jgi:hypothetical protein